MHEKYTQSIVSLVISLFSMSTTITLVYSHVDDLEIRLDIDFPSKEKFTDTTIPALIFFHGGGLVGGNRQSFVPMQFKRKFLS